MVAVFEHQRPGYAALYDRVRQGPLQGSSLMGFFDDSPPPYPTRRSVAEIVQYFREFEDEPPFIDLDATMSPGRTATKIEEAGSITEDQRANKVRESWEMEAVRAAYPSFERFEAAVDAELRQRRRQARTQRSYLDPEQNIQESVTPKLRKIPRSDRNLTPIVKHVFGRAKHILPPEVRLRLGDEPPRVQWTQRVVKTTFGHWTIKLSGRQAGSQIIRINRLLRAPDSHVPEGALAYLIYHELLHHALPGQGHDAEFRDLEGRWPDCEKWDDWYATLHEKYNINAEKYNQAP
jgi:hypothetical protein